MMLICLNRFMMMMIHDVDSFEPINDVDLFDRFMMMMNDVDSFELIHDDDSFEPIHDVD